MAPFSVKRSDAQKERWTRIRARNLQGIDLSDPSVTWAVIGPRDPGDFELSDIVLDGPGEVFDTATKEVRAAATFEEERDSIYLFACLLELDKPIEAGAKGTSLRQLFSRVFTEWLKNRFFVNPFTKKIAGYYEDEEPFYAATLEAYWKFADERRADYPLVSKLYRSKKVTAVHKSPIEGESDIDEDEIEGEELS